MMGLQDILHSIPKYREAVQECIDILLTNLVMISEIPAPTFHELMRMEFLIDRFAEYELQNCSTDDTGNALGIIPGKQGKNNILVVAHMDTAFAANVDHTVTIDRDGVYGVGTGDNSLGVAAITALPYILKVLNLELESNVILMGSSRSLGRGDIEGIRFFLANKDLPIHSGICVEGVKLGRLSYASIGMLRGEINHSVPEHYDWTRFGAGGSIVSINEIINSILEIPLPHRPKTSIVLNRVTAGASFNTIPHNALLQFEVRSESGSMVTKLGKQIQDIVAEKSSDTGSEAQLSVFARRKPGGLAFSHPLAAAARATLETLNVVPRISPSTSDLSAFIANKIPAVTIGLTHGKHHNHIEEQLEIEPIYSGMAQLIALLLAIDTGCTSADE